ncbi:MAG: C4-dicarboxylic acid transporter DauA [Kofleriaceae bacterium]|nr:C4-dicarboxylic acid transporter DauA [Kofleriaceae bacterium]
MIKRGLRYVDELSDAFRNQLALAFRSKDLLGYGLRSRMREGYTAADFRADLQAAIVVGVVALPLSMALAIAVGVPPQHGLYTAIIAGVICALLGGTRFQVSGPSAGIVVILVPIVHKFGLSGLLVAGMLAGLMQLAVGLARMGRLMQFVPHPVTTGFTMGIAVVIATLQLKDLFGVTIPRTGGTFEQLGALWDVRGAINLWDVGIGLVTVVLLLALPRASKKLPAPLVALTAITLLVVLFDHLVPGFSATTIGSKFSATIDGEVVRGIPPLPPLPVVPWHMESAGRTLDYQMIRELLPPAFAIAMLGAIESLVSATVADGMSGSQHDPNAELIALGIANVIVPFFGGIAATGALARTATNIRAGARSPVAAALHGVFVLACTIALAPLVSYLPMAALAGLLIVVAYNMSEARHFSRLVRVAPGSDVMVMLTCFVLTVAFDMAIAVTFGVLLAALMFMRRMAVLTRAHLQTTSETKLEVPEGVRVYEIAGPLFFGAAKTAMEALHVVGDKDHTVIIAMAYVPTMDATGLVALESVLDRLYRSKVKVIFAGITPEVSEILDRAGIKREPGKLAYAPDVETAISMAIVHSARLDRAPTNPGQRAGGLASTMVAPATSEATRIANRST